MEKLKQPYKLTLQVSFAVALVSFHHFHQPVYTTQCYGWFMYMCQSPSSLLLWLAQRTTTSVNTSLSYSHYIVKPYASMCVLDIHRIETERMVTTSFGRSYHSLPTTGSPSCDRIARNRRCEIFSSNRKPSVVNDSRRTTAGKNKTRRH